MAPDIYIVIPERRLAPNPKSFVNSALWPDFGFALWRIQE
jgi:hypothetical protein